MYQQERISEILKILKSVHYVTVEHLVEQIRYSPASIRRDLSVLEKQGLIKRTYGGAELLDDGKAPYKFRKHSMKYEKNKIAAAAAKLVRDGDTVFIDASTTACCMENYLSAKKDICVITNSMVLTSSLKEQGIEVYCTGGEPVELPGTLTGAVAANTFSMFHADIMFFSTDGVDSDGKIYVLPEGHYVVNKSMLENSDKHVFLCGSNKIGKKSKRVQCTLNDIDYFICDETPGMELMKKFKNTEFIKTGAENESNS